MIRKMTISALFTLVVLAVSPAFGQLEAAPAGAVPAPGSLVADQPAAPVEPGTPGAVAPGTTYRISPSRVLVLPFVTLNMPEKQLWIGRAVQEDIIADLGKARALAPVASQAPSQVEDDATAVSLAHKSNASYVIRGAAQMMETNLRLTAQFIDAQSGDTLATASVTGPMTDLLKLEDQLSGQLRTSALAIARAGMPQPYVTNNPYAPVPYGPYLGQQGPSDNTVPPYTPVYSPYSTEPYYYPPSLAYGPAYTPYYQPYYYDTLDYSYPYYPYYGGFYSAPFISYGFYGYGFGNRFCFPRDFRHARFGRHGGWGGHRWNTGASHRGWTGGGRPVQRGGFAPWPSPPVGRFPRGHSGPIMHGGITYSTNFAGGFRSGGIRSVGFHSALSPVGSIAPIPRGGVRPGGLGTPTGFGGISGGGFGGFRGGMGPGAPSGGFGGRR